MQYGIQWIGEEFYVFGMEVVYGNYVCMTQLCAYQAVAQLYDIIVALLALGKMLEAQLDLTEKLAAALEPTTVPKLESSANTTSTSSSSQKQKNKRTQESMLQPSYELGLDGHCIGLSKTPPDPRPFCFPPGNHGRYVNVRALFSSPSVDIYESTRFDGQQVVLKRLWEVPASEFRQVCKKMWHVVVVAFLCAVLFFM